MAALWPVAIDVGEVMGAEGATVPCACADPPVAAPLTMSRKAKHGSRPRVTPIHLSNAAFTTTNVSSMLYGPADQTSGAKHVGDRTGQLI